MCWLSFLVVLLTSLHGATFGDTTVDVLEKPSSRVLINSISHSCASDKHKRGIQLKRHGSLKALMRRYPHFRICCEWRRFCWLASVTFSPKVPSSVYISAGRQLNVTNRVKQTAEQQTEGDWTQMWPQLFRDDGWDVSPGFAPSPSFHVGTCPPQH